MRNLLAGVAISMFFWAMPASAQPNAAAKTARAAAQRSTGQLQFTPFQKTRELLSDPEEFASDEARLLLGHVVEFSAGASTGFGEMMKAGGEYAALGGDCFLVLYGSIHYTCLGSRAVSELTPWAPPGNTEVVAVRALAGGRWWALVERTNLSHGVASQTYHALIGGRRAGKPFVMSKPLAAAFAAIEDEGKCDAAAPAAMADSAIDSFKVESHSSGATVVFRIQRSDCRTGRIERITRRYRIAGTEDRPQR